MPFVVPDGLDAQLPKSLYCTSITLLIEQPPPPPRPGLTQRDSLANKVSDLLCEAAVEVHWAGQTLSLADHIVRQTHPVRTTQQQHSVVI
jgi:hypothetical protein